MIDAECVVCPKCGKQVEKLEPANNGQPNIVINNENKSSNVNTNTASARATAVAGGYGHRGVPKSKMAALMLCIFLGYLGAHKFYEGNKVMGIVYLCTMGLCGVGWILDIFTIAKRPSIYYVTRDGRYLGG